MTIFLRNRNLFVFVMETLFSCEVEIEFLNIIQFHVKLKMVFGLVKALTPMALYSLVLMI